jgi:hypothetical protein
MRSKLPAAAALCAALLCAAGAARAADVAILPVEGTNLSPGEVEAIGALVANAYAAESGAQVIRPADTQRLIRESRDLPEALAKLGVRAYVETTAVRLDRRINVRSTLRDAGGGLIYFAEMTAASLDDMEPISVRLARALVRRTSPELTRTLRDVTKREGQAPNRTFTEKVMGLKSAVIWPRAGDETFDASISFQFDGRLEKQWGFLEFGAGFVVPTDGTDRDGLGGVFAEFGGSLYLVEADASPYIGAGFLPRLYFTSDGGGANAAAYGQIGIMFMRESSSRIYAEFRATQSLTAIEEDENWDSFTGETTRRSIHPLELALQVGVGW